MRSSPRTGSAWSARRSRRRLTDDDGSAAAAEAAAFLGPGKESAVVGSILSGLFDRVPRSAWSPPRPLPMRGGASFTA